MHASLGIIVSRTWGPKFYELPLPPSWGALCCNTVFGVTTVLLNAFSAREYHSVHA
jgi:hypothetical protein